MSWQKSTPGVFFSGEYLLTVTPAERDNLVSAMQVQKNIKKFKMAHEQATSVTLTRKKSRKNI